MSLRSRVLLGVVVLCKLWSTSVAEATADCVAESEFTQHKCRCKKYTGYNVIRNDSVTNSTVLLGCPIPTVCVHARVNARWTLSGLDAGSLILDTNVEGPYLLRAIDGYTIGPQHGVAIDLSTGYMFVRTDFPKLLLKINCSATVYVFPSRSDGRTTSGTVERKTAVDGTMTTALTTTETKWVTTDPTATATTATPTTITAETWTSFSTDAEGIQDAVMGSVRFQTFADPTIVTVPLISEDDQTPLFVILGLLLLCLALSLLFAALYVRGVVGHRGGQWDTVVRNSRLHLPRLPRPLREHGLPEAAPALP